MVMRDSTLSIREINLSQQAQRALKSAGIETLLDISNWSVRELLSLHGLGPKTIRQLTPVLEAAGLHFKL